MAHAADTSPALGDRTSATTGSPLLLVPLGSTEQHGPHLPLDTDTSIAVAVATRVAARLRAEGRETVVAPAIPYGSSGEHQDFPGTVSIGTAVLTEVLIEFGRSAATWAPRIVFVNGHGGNLDALAAATSRLRAEGRDAAWLPCNAPGRPPPDPHAGREETALLSALRPEAVRSDRAEAGATAPLADLLPALRSGGVRAVAPNGVLGDPRGATAEQGLALLDAIVDAACRRVGLDVVAPDGCLGLGS